MENAKRTIKKNGAEIVIEMEKGVKAVENLADHNVIKYEAVKKTYITVVKDGKELIKKEDYFWAERKISPEIRKEIEAVVKALDAEICSDEYDKMIAKEKRQDEEMEKEYALAVKVKETMNADEGI